MSDTNLVTFEEAVAFAEENLRHELIHWPIKLVKYGEQIGKFQVLPFALDVFKYFAETRDDHFVKEQLNKLAGMIANLQGVTSSDVSEAVYEVWGPSIFRKATTRLFNALQSQLENNHRTYQTDIAKGFSLLVEDEHFNPNEADFEIVINFFKKEFQP